MLSIQSISFAYTKTTVIDTISFNARQGDHITIMGESGCGKSTLLKALYGLISLSKGKITYKDTVLLGPEHYLVPGHAFMKYLTQEFDLMPFISAAENIGDYLSNFYPKKKKQRIAELLELVGMTAYANTHVRYLSGGQKQRIALARVLAKEPEVLLLDEPFSQIDNFKKNELRYQLFRYLKKQKITCITATHDRNDVLPFADTILVLKNGKQLCIASPLELYQNPNNLYIASLLSEVNVVPVHLFIPNSSTEKKILLYPHEIEIDDLSPLKAKVCSCYYHGAYYLIKAEFFDHVITFQNKTLCKIDSQIGISVSTQILEQRIQITYP